MSHRILYQKYAQYYDLLHKDKDYAGEVHVLEKIIKRYKKSEGKDLLDIGCGTGHHLSYFKKNFSCTGIDFNDGMLKVARRKVKGVKFTQGDMTTFSLNQKFDVITCLYSSISYTKTLSKLRRAMDNFVRHLKPGGVVIIEPYFTPKTFRPNRPHVSITGNDNIKIARVSISQRKGKLASRETIMVIAEKNKNLVSIQENREIGLFEVEEMLTVMKESGLSAKLLKQGLNKEWGLYVGVSR